jgi:YbbR domain-containing protein
MFNALRQLVNNLGAMILALLLAFAVWIAATLQNDPFQNQEFSNVPISLLNLPDGTVLFNEDEISERVSVKVRAPESVLEEFDISDLLATMDLSTVQPGEEVPVTIQVTVTNEAVRIESIDPGSQPIHLEEMRTLTVSVAITVQGQVATGFQASPPEITPEYVSIYGPSPYLTNVISAAGVINVDGAKENVIEQIPVTPVNAEGEAVSDLELTPKQVSVKVDVRQMLGFKPDVEVVPDLQGEPAAGYRIGSISVEPSTVTLAGPQSELDKLPGFVDTMPISVTGAIENLAERTALTVPSSVVVYDVNFVTVTVEILAIQSSRAMTGVVEIQGVPPAWVATPSPTIVGVILEGPDAILVNLQPEDLQITVRLFGYSLGKHRIPPEVLAPADVTVVSVIPETIEVEIAPTPTPTPTLTVTPTITVPVTTTP